MSTVGGLGTTGASAVRLGLAVLICVTGSLAGQPAEAAQAAKPAKASVATASAVKASTANTSGKVSAGAKTPTVEPTGRMTLPKASKRSHPAPAASVSRGLAPKTDVGANIPQTPKPNAAQLEAASKPKLISAACAVPSAPPSVTVTAGANSIKVTWTAAPDNGTPLSAYVATAASSTGTITGPAIAVAGTALTTTVTGLPGAAAATIAVTAVSACGQGPAKTSPAVTPTGSTTTYASAVAASAPSAYYRLGEPAGLTVAADSSTHHTLLTYGSSGTLASAGALGAGDPDTGVTVNGGCCVATGTVAALPQFNTARSVEAWVKPTDGYARWFAGWGHSDTDTAFNVGVQDSAVLLDGYGDQLSFPVGHSLVDGNWHHVVVSYDGVKASAYLDGLPVGSKAFAADLDTVNDNGMVVGAYENGGSPFYGGLDDVAVYPTALTAATVAAHFAASGYTRPQAPAVVSGSDGAANEAVVSWSVGRPTTPPITRYQVVAIQGGVRRTSVIVAGNKTAARVTGLAGGSSYTFAVSAGNAYGLGTEALTGAVAISGTATPYAATVGSDGPSVFYRLGEPAGAALGADSAGKGNLLQYNRVALQAPGAISTDVDRAATADGSCCIGTGHPSLPAFDSARSVEFWAKPSDSQGRWALGWGNSDTDAAFSVGTGDSSVIVSAYSDDLTFPTTRPLNDGAWHQIVLTYDRTRATAYLDGAAIGAKTFVNPLDTVDDSGLVLGSAFNGSSPFYGSLDEVAVYPSALTAARVQAHFAASGHAVPAVPATVTATAGANQIAATWTASPAGSDPVTSYQVSALKAGVVTASVAVPGSATSAHLTGLPGAVAYTVRVVGSDAYGSGAAALSAAVTPTGAASTYLSTVQSQAPTAYYRLGEAVGTPIAADSAGHSQPLTLATGTLGTAGSLIGDANTAATADGSCCIGSVTTAMPGYATARTVEAWVKPADAQPRWFAGWGGSSTGSAFNVGVQDTQVMVDGYNDSLAFQAARSLVDGKWHHVVVTYDGTLAHAYLDGISLGAKTFATPLDTLDGSVLRVGSYDNGGSPFYGGLDEVAIYPSALSTAQVVAHFTASGHSAPGAVTGVTATAGVNAATVSWVAPATADGITGYVITALNAGVAAIARSATGSGTSATVTGLLAGTPYTIRVQPRNVYGDGTAVVSAAVTPTGTATTYASTVLAAGPAAYYRFGDPAGASIGADSSGRNHPLSYSVATLGLLGAIPADPDRAVSANGGCCVGSAVSALPAQNSARTVEAWVQPLDASARWFAGWGGADTRHGFDVGLQGDTVLVSSYGDDLALPIGHSIVDGGWHQIVVVYDGTKVIGYVDGVALAARTFTAALHTTPGTPLIAGAYQSGGAPFYGGLDELAIYPSALTGTQVAAHFTASGAGPPPALTGLTVSPRANGAAVTWTAAPAAGKVTRIQVSAMKGSVAQNALVVPATATSATLTGLAGGSSYTIQVTASNLHGTGPAATSAAVLPTGATSTYASTVLSQSPIAYYRLGEATGLTAAADSSGKAGVLTTADGTFRVPGAVVGDADTAVTGDGGCCIGSAIAPLPAFNTARSVEAWVKPLDSQTRWIAGWGTNATGKVFDVGIAGNTVAVSGYADDLSFPVGRSLVDGAWHHVVVSYDGSAATAYLDGVALGTKTFTTALNTVTTGFLRVGAAVAGDGPVYGGLDELAVYPSALTATQVSAHFAASGHRPPGAPTAVTATPVTNGVSVSWTAPTAVVDGITRYVVTALRAGVPVNAVATTGSAGSAVITGLPAGTALTVKVLAGNAYGDGPAGVSASVTPNGTSTTTYASAVLADAPSAYYRLGEATGTLVGADSSGKAPPLTYGQVALGATGALPHDVDTGATANGSCCIGTAPATLLPRFNSARSVEAWVKPTDTYGRWVAGWGTSATDKAFDVGLDGTDVLVSEYAGDLSFPVGHTLVDGAWHHLVVTYDGTSVRAYVDGVALGTQTFPAALNTSSTAGFLQVGAGQDGASPAYGGVDDVAIYPSVLSQARISAHYAAR